MSTCIVVGNGNTLKDVPNEWLALYPTFGTNRCYLKFTPTYYVAVNPLVIEQSVDEINKLDCKKYIRASLAHKIKGSIPLTQNSIPKFSLNPLFSIYEGYTVTYVALQLAFFLGYRTVYLVGVDHRYQQNGKNNEQTIWRGDDPNHFSPDYFRDTVWNNPDLEKSEKSYRMANDFYNQHGGKIINLTPNSALDVFKKGNILW